MYDVKGEKKQTPIHHTRATDFYEYLLALAISNRKCINIIIYIQCSIYIIHKTDIILNFIIHTYKHTYISFI